MPTEVPAAEPLYGLPTIRLEPAVAHIHGSGVLQRSSLQVDYRYSNAASALRHWLRVRLCGFVFLKINMVLQGITKHAHDLNGLSCNLVEVSDPNKRLLSMCHGIPTL